MSIYAKFRYERDTVWVLTCAEGGEAKKRGGLLTFCSVENHCLASWHRNGQNRAQHLFKLLIKRLAPSSFALKLAKGVHARAYRKISLKQHLYDNNASHIGVFSMI